MMHKNKLFLTVIVAFISIQTAVSQNNTNSPYTRFGFGQLHDNTSGEQRGMGGVAIGARSKQRINTVNPASYSVSDSLTFMFDFGISTLGSRFTDDAMRRNTNFTGNLDYLTMQFRLFPGVGFSAGILPYSFAGYNFFSNDSVPMPGFGDDPTQVRFTENFSGSGGINQIYTGLSFSLFNQLSLGVNLYYMFGAYNNVRSAIFAQTAIQPTHDISTIYVNNVRFRFGAQYFNTFANRHEFTFGAIYEPKTTLGAEATRTTTTHVTETDTLTNSAFSLPQTLGFGLFYTFDRRLSVGIDYSLQQWSNALFFGTTNDLIDSWQLAVGLEYQPNFRSRRFRDRIMYRAGANIGTPYFRIGDEMPGNNFGITFGLGFPLSSSSRTVLNMAFEYGQIGTSPKLREDYFKFTFNIALAETWFFQRRL